MNTPLNIVKTGSCSTNNQPEEQEHLLRVQWEGSQCFIDGKPFHPKIGSLNELDREKFNTVVISIDGQTKSELKWEKELQVADQLIEKGYNLFWHIDLGLFDRLPFSLLNKSQLMTLSIAIEHFIENVWPKYEGVTIGLSIYEGSLDFIRSIPWNTEMSNNLRNWVKESYETMDLFNKETNLKLSTFEEISEESIRETDALQLYGAEICVNYLDILAGRVPEELACFVCLDTSAIQSPLLQARMLSAERAEHIRFVLQNGLLPPADITWNSSHSPFGYYGFGQDTTVLAEKASLGVCLPEIAHVKESHYEGLDNALDLLLNDNVAFRVIPEALLTTEWDGLDDLIVTTPGVSVWGLRKLQGFCAAGGRVVFIGPSLGLPEEISFSEWLIQHKMRS